ncbi:MAG: hypothetical protein HY960_12510 [Ignavibacteriae bacterium]|nr:hypothetical protein [Ignavibacteriota bacterium]
MTKGNLFCLFAVAMIVLVFAISGCERDTSMLESATYPKDAEVFTDQFGPAIQYQSFGDSKLDALQMDETETYSGTTSLKISVPNDGYMYSTYPYAGGAFVSTSGRDLRGYNVLTFWARATVETKFNFGIGNDNTGTSKYTAQVSDVALHQVWTKYVFPIPSPEKLSKEKGLFFFSAANLNGVGYNFWLDEIKYENIGTITDPRTSITTSSFNNAIEGDTFVIDKSIDVKFNLNGRDQTVQASPSYLKYFSSADTVASVSTDGVIKAVGPGSAIITAKLGSVNATGQVAVNNVKAALSPTTPATTPLHASDKVISIFSDTYSNIPVDTWSAEWTNHAKVENRTINDNNVKVYTNLDFAGIIFSKNTIDASMMTHFHLDIWTQYPTSSASFKVKLVDFGNNGKYGGGDDVQSECTFTSTTQPNALRTGSWISLDIPLSDFAALTTRSHLAQLIISGGLKTVWVDNVYLYQGTVTPGQTAPTTAAPLPTVPSVNVISLFSDNYNNNAVDTWSAQWDMADETYRSVAGNDVMLYTNLDYAGIEFTGANQINASSMENFHVDIWTPNSILGATFKVKLVDFGVNGVYGGGDDVQSELTFTSASSPSPLRTASWVSLDIPLASFTGLTTKANLSQLILSATGALKTIWVDNIYFYKVIPATGAPIPPVRDEADVISLFSDAYTNHPVNGDIWAASWQYSTAIVTNKTIGSDNVKVYTNLNFAGVEFTGANMIDASTMNYFHIDVWTPNSVVSPSAIKIKLVDFGGNGVYGGSDDTAFELTFNSTSTPPLVTGGWVSLDIQLSRFTGLTQRAHLAQLIVSGAGDVKTVWFDNVYFHK